MQTAKTQDMSPWIADQGDGTFINPVLCADYSDPDVARLGADYYMTASSFGHIPGLPILHSRDLVNWSLIGHAIAHMPLEGYDRPQHGNGVWAPSLRFHEGKWLIYYGDPDIGIFVVASVTSDPAGDWRPPQLVVSGKGLIDPCPFWDEDGNAYLVHAYANSRSGIKHKLRLCRMSWQGDKLLDEGKIVFDDPEAHPTLEGPKLYKRNGFYYIFAPAGGVATGWQTVLRAKEPIGPYEARIVLHQGKTAINGPHQGGWVDTPYKEDWFLHFQDDGAYGRIVHLQPVEWRDDWPIIGADEDGDGIGEPVLRYRKPKTDDMQKIAAPLTSDEFNANAIGLQWQWQANPRRDWYSLTERKERLRLFAWPQDEAAPSLYRYPALLLQKFPAKTFVGRTRLDGSALKPGERAGLIVFGYAYAGIELRRDAGGDYCLASILGDQQSEQVLRKLPLPLEGTMVELRVTVGEGAVCRFAYLMDEGKYRELPDCFTAKEGQWVGAKLGLYTSKAALEQESESGYADFEWFRVERGGTDLCEADGLRGGARDDDGSHA